MRRVARAQMKNTYFTGVPCKNGHLAYRYVQSGTCSQCIRAASAPVVDRPAHKSIVESLVPFKARLWKQDVESFRNVVYAAGALRSPLLGMRDLCPLFKPTRQEGDSAVYRFNAFPEDVDNLQNAALRMFAERCYKVTA